MENMYTLFSVLHSEALKLFRVDGDTGLGVPGKILSALEDGSLAVISPVTGAVLTIVYPLNTFQVIIVVQINITIQGKDYAKTLQNKWLEIVEPKLTHARGGFCRGRSTVD